MAGRICLQEPEKLGTAALLVILRLTCGCKEKSSCHCSYKNLIAGSLFDKEMLEFELQEMDHFKQFFAEKITFLNALRKTEHYFGCIKVFNQLARVSGSGMVFRQNGP